MLAAAAAYEAHPERLPNGPPVIQQLRSAVYINPPFVMTVNRALWRLSNFLRKVSHTR